MPFTVPGPRGPHSSDSTHGHGHGHTVEGITRFYEETLGRQVLRDRADGPPRLATGILFDALELPARAGRAVVDRLDGAERPCDHGRDLGAGCPCDHGAGHTCHHAAGHPCDRPRPVTGPVALSADRSRMWLLLAPGSAEEVPGLLDWLEWGGIALDLDALGEGRSFPAPLPPRWPVAAAQGAAVWLRPPGAVRGADDRGEHHDDRGGQHVEEPARRPARSARSGLPGLPALRLCGGAGGIGTSEIGTGGSGGDAPDLVRLVDAAAAECHRVRLARGLARGIAAGANRQPLAFS